MTAIRKTISQITYSQHITNLTTDYCTSNDRFGFIVSCREDTKKTANCMNTICGLFYQKFG